MDLFCQVQNYSIIPFLKAEVPAGRFCLFINSEISFSFPWISGLQGTSES